MDRIKRLREIRTERDCSLAEAKAILAKEEGRPMKEQQEAIAELRELLKPGDTVYCILRHDTRSYATHSISPVIIRDGEPREITYLVVPVLGWGFDHKHGGIKVSTSGACPRSQLVNALGRKLYPNADAGFPVLYNREL